MPAGIVVCIRGHISMKSVSQFLYKYENADFSTQLKARFVFYLCFTAFFCVLASLLFTLYIQEFTQDKPGLNLNIIMGEVLIAFVFITCLFVLIRGNFKVAGHALMIFMFAGIWEVLFVDKGEALIRLDTLVLVLAAFSMLPIIILDKKNEFVAYYAINIIIFYFYMFTFADEMRISEAAKLDVLVDTSIAFVFSGIVGYNVQRINKRSLERMENDIKEREIAEKALAASEKKFREMADMLPQVVFECNRDGLLTYVNKNSYYIFGYSDEEIKKGINIYSTIVRTEHEKITENIKELVEGKQNKGHRYLAVKRDGTTFPVMIFSDLIKENEIITGFRGIIIDISEKENAEKELQEAKERQRAKLEFLVEQRTKELSDANEELITINNELTKRHQELQKALDDLNQAQNQLIEAEKMASIGILAAGIAHEINNPLNFIKGGITGFDKYFNEHLPERVPEVATLIKGINMGVDRAAQIVTSLNHFSRTNDSADEDCYIHSIIENCLIILQNKIKHKITVEKHFSDQLLTIKGNEGKLHQAFLNILTNSYQAIKDTGNITISTNQQNNCVNVVFSDNGCGISDENLQKVFNPFFTTKEPGEGTGLGMAITYKIIQEHKGRINLFSELEKGTTVTITLPKERNV